MIDLSSLRQALSTLDEALAAHARAPDDTFIRDACIQRFEYTYEMASKMLRRYLDASEPTGVRELSFPSLVRLGYERGLLAESWDVWTAFRDARNATSQTYNEAKANDVMGKLPGFAAAARFLAVQIEARQK